MSRHPLTRLAAVTSCTALALTTLASTAAAAPSPRPTDFADASDEIVSVTDGTKSPTSALAQTPDSLLGLTSGNPVDVIVKYDYDAVASYEGGVAGYSATSPKVTGKELSTKDTATRRYEAFVKGQERDITADVKAAVPGVTVHESFTTVYGGVAATVPGDKIDELLAVPGVVAVQEDVLNQPLTDSSIEFINAPAAYEALGTDSLAGAGVVYANLDTGLWPEHPSFTDDGALPDYTGPAIPCEFGDNPLTPEADPFECNDKLIGGRHFTDSYDRAYPPGTPEADMYAGTARDGDGHGSHTASTSSGVIVEHPQPFGPDIAKIQGVAPGAQIIEYKVCGPEGCRGADTMSATQQAILDGADVLNYSISGGTSPLTDPTELAFFDAYNAGVFVAASAGNNGPAAATANHLSPWVTTVAASTQKRTFTSSFTLTADDGTTFTGTGASLTAGVETPAPVVLASSFDDPLCQNPAPADVVAGKIVLCQRGVNARVAKGYNVSQGGAAGMILFNATLADTALDNHYLPTVHVADGTELKAWALAHSGITGSFTAGVQAEATGDVMAAFSSRGPAGAFIKPDITAPGVQILAAATPTPQSTDGGPAGNYYQAIGGTSMSSPHIAGVAILLKAVHPDWTPGEIKSAIMTQSTTAVVKEDLVTPADPFDMGAGRVDVGAALDAPITISDDALDMFLKTGDPVHAVDINLPSINAPLLPGRLTTVRTLKNMTADEIVVQPKATVPAGSSITFNRRSYTIPAGGTADVAITISTSAAEGVQQFGQVVFHTNKGDSHIPVAFVPGQGGVTLDQNCDATELRRGATTTCTVTATNTTFTDQEVDVDTFVSRGSVAVGGQTSASGDLSAAAEGTPSMVDTGSPAFVDLGAFGIPANTIGDEQFLNWDVPAFTFNGQTYTRLSINSNGYIVAGPAGSTDNNCCNLPGGPSPDRPNSVMAPFWTDLDGTGAPGIRIASSGPYRIVQWEVFDWGTQHLRKFQVWVLTGTTQEITYSYSEPQVASLAGDFLVGAENGAGLGDMRAILPANDILVESSPAIPGGSLTYSFTLTGIKAGTTATVRTEMTSPTISGVTVVQDRIRVVR
ncbi:S8 family serine peptidase [Antribacter sp. KLBMP9083]|uniref:S8 family serine peptidase n=1 Tax=Antribacter soli TaxID=2910976 RepID=A0AA41QCZ0_9MICO|nr:S8 family serine peptidase [Antribacter soli]